ncbi:MAG: LysR family transcriptional regulator [Ruminococcus sp.]
MTLQQLQYVIAIVEHGSISETAKQLYVAQPTLSSAVRTLEEEFGIVIFHRSARGSPSPRTDGSSCPTPDRWWNRQTCSTSTTAQPSRHASGVPFPPSTMPLRWTLLSSSSSGCPRSPTSSPSGRLRTHEIMEDVRNFDSEIGILYLSSFNEKVIRAMLEEYHLEFHSLVNAEPHVFLRAEHPLAGRASVTTADLEPYPFLCFEQGVHNSFYFAEELLSTMPHKKCIRVSDRATLFNLLRGVNGYTICSGMVSADLNGGDIVSVPLDTPERMEIGWISNPRIQESHGAQLYIQELQQVLMEYQQPVRK